jgi:hypothetical protein
MSSNIRNNPSGSFTQAVVNAGAGAVTLGAHALEAIEKPVEAYENTVGTAEDAFWTAVDGTRYAGQGAEALSSALETATSAGGVLSRLGEWLHPAPTAAAGEATSKLAGAFGEHAGTIVETVDKALESPIGQVAEKSLTYVGFAAAAYDGYKGFTDKDIQTTGGHVVNGLAQAGVVAAEFMTGPVGYGIMAADLVTGGGVTGSVKGLVAAGEGIWTGDNTAVEKWTEGAKSGEYGWLVKAAANNETASKIIGGGAKAVVTGVVEQAKAEIGVVKGAVAGVTSLVTGDSTAVKNFVADVKAGKEGAVLKTVAEAAPKVMKAAATAEKAVVSTVSSAVSTVSNAVSGTEHALGNAVAGGWKLLTSW